MDKVIVLGASISGLGAGCKLLKIGECPILLEKDYNNGGLCSNFEI